MKKTLCYRDLDAWKLSKHLTGAVYERGTVISDKTRFGLLPTYVGLRFDSSKYCGRLGRGMQGLLMAGSRISRAAAWIGRSGVVSMGHLRPV